MCIHPENQLRMVEQMRQDRSEFHWQREDYRNHPEKRHLLKVIFVKSNIKKQFNGLSKSFLIDTIIKFRKIEIKLLSSVKISKRNRLDNF